MTTHTGPDFVREISIGSRSFRYFSLAAAEAGGRGDFGRLPYSLKVLAENLLRHEAGPNVLTGDVEALGAWCAEPGAGRDLSYHPGRVVMPEIGGLPLLVDLCAMRDAMARAGGDPDKINPQIPVDLIVDHSVVADVAGVADALEQNMAIELARNTERYRFLKWAALAFDKLKLIPPGNGILHQINIEHLASVVAESASADGLPMLAPDCLIGMDSHTPMVNAIGVMGWGVGGVEAGAAMLGQPVSLRLPEVVGCRLLGQLAPNVTATDLVLTVVERLRAHGVVQKFVEFCGAGLNSLAVTDRATLSNMAPEYGATMGFMPVDERTLEYLRQTGRTEAHIEQVKSYLVAQSMLRSADSAEPVFSSVVEIDLDAVEPTMAGPFRPTQRTALGAVRASFERAAAERNWPSRQSVQTASFDLHDGVIGLAAITSCTNTSNPAVMLGAGLLARNAVALGLTAKPWVKRSLAPGSRVVAEYLALADLTTPLNRLGFNIVGFGCTTCMGNSGDLDADLSAAVEQDDLTVAAVLSGNRNFEGRVHPQCKAAYLASPALVVAYAIAGTVNIDLSADPLGHTDSGKPVFLRDIWPSREELDLLATKVVKPEMFVQCYARGGTFETGTEAWQALAQDTGSRFAWDLDSHYLIAPPYFEDFAATPPPLQNIARARALLIVGDMVTTDHISPVNVVPEGSVAGDFLAARGLQPSEFSSYAARRANHEVMVRGTFASPRLINELCPDERGGSTRHVPSGELLSVYDAALRYRQEGTALVVIGGTEYGTGSSRDWAAKGTMLLGVRAVIAESIERIHRSNLVGLGVLPVQFPAGVSRETLALDGTEEFDLAGIATLNEPGGALALTIHRVDGSVTSIEVICRLDTRLELDYFKQGGMLTYALRRALQTS
jgi:aconitate hydratase